MCNHRKHNHNILINKLCKFENWNQKYRYFYLKHLPVPKLNLLTLSNEAVSIHSVQTPSMISSKQCFVFHGIMYHHLKTHHITNLWTWNHIDGLSMYWTMCLFCFSIETHHKMLMGTAISWNLQQFILTYNYLFILNLCIYTNIYRYSCQIRVSKGKSYTSGVACMSGFTSKSLVISPWLSPHYCITLLHQPHNQSHSGWADHTMSLEVMESDRQKHTLQ